MEICITTWVKTELTVTELEALTEFELELDNLTTDGVGIIRFTQQSDTEFRDDVDAIVSTLTSHDISAIRMSIEGDDEPFVKLITVENGQPVETTIDDALYQYIAGCSSNELTAEYKQAKKKGPEVYFTEQYQAWKRGFEVIDAANIDELLTTVIEASLGYQ